MLAQSQRSVRGTRVHKLRCDEVDEFDRDVWDAAQLTTMSGVCGSTAVRGGVEAISMMHRPYGLMSGLVRREVVRGEVLEAGDARVFRWCALDVVERCESWRSCDGCALWEDCRGVARRGTGFVSVEDLLASKRRVSDAVWESEMMCRRPRTDAAVYPTFSVARHARGVGDVERSMSGGAVLIAGMDLGLRNPVTLWALVHPRGSQRDTQDPRGLAPEDSSPGVVGDEVIEVIGECLVQSSTLEEHLARAAALMPGRPVWVGVDPAGRQRNAQTGVSDLEVLRRRGYAVRARPTSILHGIECVRRRLDRGTLVIHPRCAALIRAMSEYHFDPERPNREEPVKDGPDHACDALRYMIVSYEQGSSASGSRSYL